MKAILKLESSYSLVQGIKLSSFLMQLQYHIRQINKTIDIFQREQVQNSYCTTLLDKFSQVLINQNYTELQDVEIYKEYQNLRKQIFTLNDLVALQLQKLSKKAERKQANTKIQPQKLNELSEKQMQNNFKILQRMKKQYKSLQYKSSTLQSKQIIEAQIQKTKEQIQSIKRKLISLKLKTKIIANNIVNTDKILEELKQSERENQVWIKKRKELSVKVQKINSETQKILQYLENVQKNSIVADDFSKARESNQKVESQKRVNQELYNEKKHYLQILKKNHEINSGLKKQKYHQLLKQFEHYIQKQESAQKRFQQIQYQMVQCSDQIQFLKKKFNQVREQKTRLQMIQSSSNHSEEKSINFDLFFESNKTKARMNLAKSRHESIFDHKDAKIISTNNKSQSTTEVESEKIVNQKMVSVKTIQTKNERNFKVLNKTLTFQAKQGLNQKIQQSDFSNANLNKIHEVTVHLPQKLQDKNFDPQSPFSNQKINSNSLEKIKKGLLTQSILSKKPKIQPKVQLQKQRKAGILKKQLIHKENNSISFMQQRQSSQKFFQKQTCLSQKKKDEISKLDENHQAKHQEKSNDLGLFECIDKKFIENNEEQNKMQKFTIDLGLIQTSIQKAIQERQKRKQNFSIFNRKLLENLENDFDS